MSSGVGQVLSGPWITQTTIMIIQDVVVHVSPKVASDKEVAWQAFFIFSLHLLLLSVSPPQLPKIFG